MHNNNLADNASDNKFKSFELWDIPEDRVM